MTMQKNQPTTRPSYTLLDCEISPVDFEDMNYYSDSGMYDFTTKNAAALALKRYLKSNVKAQITHHSGSETYYCLIKGKSYPIQGELNDVFEAANHGVMLHGFHFWVEIPEKYIKTSESAQKVKSIGQ